MCQGHTWAANRWLLVTDHDRIFLEGMWLFDVSMLDLLTRAFLHVGFSQEICEVLFRLEIPHHQAASAIRRLVMDLHFSSHRRRLLYRAELHHVQG